MFYIQNARVVILFETDTIIICVKKNFFFTVTTLNDIIYCDDVATLTSQ